MTIIEETLCVGINGFGPVGRTVFYAALQDPRISVVAINDASFSTACIAYMMERECPPFLPPVHAEVMGDNVVTVGGAHRIAITQETRPTKWGDHQVQVVLECTGTTTTRERCLSHVTFGAQHVVVAAHSADAPLAHTAIRPAEGVCKDGRAIQVHSCGSRLGAVLAPLLHLLDRDLGLEEVSYTVISGISEESDPAAGRSADPLDWRQLRLQQFTATGKGAFAPSARCTGLPTLERFFPHLQGRLCASDFQVPGHNGCAIDLFVRTGKSSSKEEIDALIARGAAEQSPFVKVFNVARDGAMISTDCLGTDSLIYEKDVSSSLAGGHSHKLMLWVDLEWAYAQQVVALAKCIAGTSQP